MNYFFKTLLVFLFIASPLFVKAQLEDPDYEPTFFSSNTNTTDNVDPVDVLDGDDPSSGIAPIDDYLPLLGIVAIGLGIFYRKRLLKSI